MEAFAVAAMEIAPNPAPKSASPVSGTATARPLPAAAPAATLNTPRSAPPITINSLRGSRSAATVSAPRSDPSPIAAINPPRPAAPICSTTRESGGMMTLKFIATPEITPITKTQSATIGVRCT